MLTAFVVVLAAMVVTAVASLLLGLRARRNDQADDRDSDSRGFLGAVVSGLFIVALAFYMVIVWEEGADAEDNAAREAAAIADAYWQTAVLPQPQRDTIRGLLREYPTQVADNEWPRLAVGKSDDRTAETLTALHNEIVNLPATPDQVKSARERALERVREITDLRRGRLDQAGGLDNTGWIMLIGTLAGAAGMVAFPLLIGFTAGVRHVLQMAVTAGVLAFVCWLCLQMMSPFTGILRVEPEAYTSVVEELAAIPVEQTR